MNQYNQQNQWVQAQQTVPPQQPTQIIPQSVPQQYAQQPVQPVYAVPFSESKMFDIMKRVATVILIIGLVVAAFYVFTLWDKVSWESRALQWKNDGVVDSYYKEFEDYGNFGLLYQISMLFIGVLIFAVVLSAKTLKEKSLLLFNNITNAIIAVSVIISGLLMISKQQKYYTYNDKLKKNGILKMHTLVQTL